MVIGGHGRKKEKRLDAAVARLRDTLSNGPFAFEVWRSVRAIRDEAEASVPRPSAFAVCTRARVPD